MMSVKPRRSRWKQIVTTERRSIERLQRDGEQRGDAAEAAIP